MKRPGCHQSQTFRSALASLLALLLTGCASLTHEPGTPYGGAYCTQRGGDPEPACYPSEADRSAAWHQREAEGRKAWAAEHPAEARAEAAERAHLASDFQARQRAEVQVTADLAAARVQEADDREAARAAEDQARQAEAARLELACQRTADPTYAIPALSALLCQQQAREAEFRADLQREARITAISGVVDKRSRSSLAAGVVDAQDRSGRLRQRLRAVGVTQPLPCAAIATLLACRAGDELACRSDPSARGVVDVLQQIEREP
jgi:hypothetical protein